MKELIDKYGRDWRVLTGAGLATAGLAAATIFLGLYKSIAALFVAGALALAAVVIAVFRWLAKRARGRTALELEKGILGLPTPALADGRTSVPELTRKFREALDKLRNAPELGHDYLYRVPWYAIIGEPAAGKTTTITHSKLDVIGDRQRGVGGTLNCDWWFTNSGVLLDTAGRYVFSEEGAPDRKEWEAFLALLRKFRPRQPVNGVILVIPVVRKKESGDIPLLLPPADPDAEAELLERCSRDAEKLYAKISQLPQRLGVRFPVYLLVTKCDKIPGFQEFFIQASQEYQRQLLGWSSPDVDPKPAYSPAMVDKAFESVGRSLARARLEILSRETPLGFPDEVFVFPEEFRRLREPLKRYTDALFRQNIFQESLLFRGIYFTSGLQDRRPLEGLIGVADTEAALAAEAAAVPQSKPSSGEFSMFGKGSPSALPLFESKPFFIDDFYSEKVFPESGLVRPTQRIYEGILRRIRMLRAAALVIGVGGLVGSVLYLGAVLQDSTRLAQCVGDVANRLRAPAALSDAAIDEDLELVNSAIGETRKYSLLSFLGLAPPLERVRKDAILALDTLVLTPLAQRFEAKLKEGITRELEGQSPGVGEIESIPDSALVKKMREVWNKKFFLYQEVRQADESNLRKPISNLYALAMEKPLDEKSGSHLLSFLIQFGESDGAGVRRLISDRLRALPALKIRAEQVAVSAKLDELDRALKLDVEKSLDLLVGMAEEVNALENASLPLKRRSEALENVLLALEKPLLRELRKEGGPKEKVEKLFEEQFQERKKLMDEVRAIPLLEDSKGRGAMAEAVSAVRERLEATSPPPVEERSQARLSELKAMIAGEKLRLKGDDFPPPGISMLKADAFALVDPVEAFLKRIQKVQGSGILQLARNDAKTPDGERLRIAVGNLDRKRDFLADARHVKLIGNTEKIVSALRGAFDQAPPDTSLLRVVRGLAEQSLWAELESALTDPPGDSERPGAAPDSTEKPGTVPSFRVEAGSGEEKTLLRKIQWAEGVPAELQKLVETIQNRHALNRLQEMRDELMSKEIFKINREAVKEWRFEIEGSEETNLQRLFGRTGGRNVGVKEYFDLKLENLGSDYLRRVVFVKDYLAGAKNLADEDIANLNFWKATFEEAKTGAAEKISDQQTLLRRLLERVVTLKASPNPPSPYKDLVGFLAFGEAQKDAKPEGAERVGKGFLTTRFDEIQGVVKARILAFLSAEFVEGFKGRDGFNQKAHDILLGKFPVYFNPAVAKPGGQQYRTPDLVDIWKRQAAFAEKWGLAATREQGALWPFIVDLFVEKKGIDLVREQLQFLDYIRKYFIDGKYVVELKILNREFAAADRDLPGLKSANMYFVDFWLRSQDQGREKLYADPDEKPKTVSWKTGQSLTLGVGLPPNKVDHHLSLPGAPPDPQSPITAEYSYPAKDQAWSIFQMLVEHLEELPGVENVLKFEFELHNVITGGKPEKVPLYVQLRIKPEKEAEPFSPKEVHRLYHAFFEEDLQLK